MSFRRIALAAALITTGMTAGCTENVDAYGEDFAAVLRGEMNFTDLVDRIAAEEFRPSANLTIEKIEVSNERPGEFRRSVESDRGYLFYFVTVRVINNGTMDLPVSTWQFSVVDHEESEVNAKTTIPHHDFDGTRLRAGAQRVGVLVFELREGSEVKEVVWDGMLTQARGGWADDAAHEPTPRARDADEARPPAESGDPHQGPPPEPATPP